MYLKGLIVESYHSIDRIDEMTGGLVRDEPNPLDGMTDEEKEQEARKLNDLIHRLNRYCRYMHVHVTYPLYITCIQVQ